MLRLIFLSCSILLFTHSSQSQLKQTELGFGVGAFNYTGDLSRKYRLSTHRPAFTAFYKYTLDEAINFRAALSGGFIYGDDSRSDDPFNQQRGRSFRVFALEATTGFEYNFLDLKSANQIVYGTPYVYAGIGVTGFSGNNGAPESFSPVQPIVPLGLGFKYVLGPYWYVGVEVGARFLFFDYLDGVSYGDPRFKDYQYGNWYDNDNYYFISLTATYSFFKIPCPRSPY